MAGQPLPLRIMVSRHAAFYSPLIAGVAAGFFAEEGFAPTYAVVPAGTTVAQHIAAGDVDVAQSAVSASWLALERGQPSPLSHFAQVNQRDGFFLAARDGAGTFRWEQLCAGGLLYVHGGQPQAMLAYALHRKGIELSELQGINRGSTQEMLQAFRAGEGAWFHEQGPYPQQLETEGVARVVAAVGEVIGPVAFSSVAATRDWARGPAAPRFMRAYRKARAWVNSAPPAEVAAREAAYFPGITPGALTRAIEAYQNLGTWSGDVAIEREPYERALDVFAHSKLITRRHPYEEVVIAPPDA